MTTDQKCINGTSWNSSIDHKLTQKIFYNWKLDFQTKYLSKLIDRELVNIKTHISALELYFEQSQSTKK